MYLFFGTTKTKNGVSEKGALFATLQWQSREAQDPKSFANHFRAVINMEASAAVVSGGDASVQSKKGVQPFARITA